MATVGTQRSEAAWRIFAFVYGMLAAAIAGVVTFVGLIWGVVDVLWQLVTNRNDLSENSYPARLVTSTLRWAVDLQVYAFTGAGKFRWVPDV